MWPVVIESKLEKLFDYLMLPIMYLVQFNLLDSPQKTHFWNRCRYQTSELLKSLDKSRFLELSGSDKFAPRWLGFLPLLHIPVLGGWKEYYVIEPIDYMGPWHVGWVLGEFGDVSKIVITGPVRVLKADIDVEFFGLNTDGQQIGLKLIGAGTLGKTKEYAKIPLL